MWNNAIKISFTEELDEEQKIALKLLFPNATIEILKKETENEKYLAQKEFCKKKNFPMFAKKVCTCGHHVFDDYSVETSSKRLITNCRKCNKSFVD